MSDFRKQFQELIEHTNIPSNADMSIVSDMWNRIYKLIYPNIPDKLFRYRRIDENGYNVESFKSGTISLCQARMFPDKYDSYTYINQSKVCEDIRKSLKDVLHITWVSLTESSTPELMPEKVKQIWNYKNSGYTEEQVADKLFEEYAEFCNVVGTAIKKRNPISETLEMLQK